MEKKTIGPVTSIQIESLEREIRDLLSGIDSNLLSLRDSSDMEFMQLGIANIEGLNAKIRLKQNELLKRQLEHTRLVNHIGHCLGASGGIINGVQYFACCPVNGVCICAGSENLRIDILATFETVGSVIKDQFGKIMTTTPINLICPTIEFCQQDHIISVGIKAFEFAPLFKITSSDGLETAKFPSVLEIDGIPYSLNF